MAIFLADNSIFFLVFKSTTIKALFILFLFKNILNCFVLLILSLTSSNIIKFLFLVFWDIEDKINKTKEFNKFLKKNKINNALIVVDLKTKKSIELSARNIANIKLIEAYYLNTYDILKYKQIMFTKSSTKELEKRLLGYE